MNTTHNITFSVDLTTQINDGIFNSNIDLVEVRGSLNDWWGGTLIAQNDNIYTGTFDILGNTGDIIYFKYWTQSLFYEKGLDRNLTLGDPNIPQVLDTVFFNG